MSARKIKRLITTLTIACMAMTCMAAPAFAGSSLKTVYVTTTQNYTMVQQELNQINKERKKRGLNKLKLDKSLTNAAVQRAAEIGIYIPMTSPHKRPNGKRVKSLNKKIDYECCLESYGMYFTGKDVVKDWMSSPSHKRGILLKGAKSIGIAFVTTPGGNLLCTLEISKKKAKSKVTRKSGFEKMVKKVKAKPKYVKSSFFRLSSGGYGEMFVGDKMQAVPLFSSSYMLGQTGLWPGDFTSWKSSDPSIASVSNSGQIVANGSGVVTISAKKKSYPQVTVKVDISVIDPDEVVYL